MSTGDRWHESEAVEGEDPIVPQAILLWMRSQGNAGQSVLPWEADTDDAVRPEAPDENADSEEVLAHLLRAIENTEVAARLQSVVLPDKGHAPASILHELPVPEVGSSELPPDLAQKNSEAFSQLLRAIESAESAEAHQGVPQEECAEPAASACTPPAQAAETPAAFAQEPQTEASAPRGTARPAAANSSEPSAAALHDIQSADAGMNFEVLTPPGEWDPGEPAASEPVENAAAASPLPPPVARPRHAASRQQNRRARRASRRRQADWQRSDYLLSIAAPAPASCAAEKESEPTEAAERWEPLGPVEPLPAMAEATVADPERLPITEAEAIAEAPTLPAQLEPEAIATAPTPPAEASGATPKPPIPATARLGTGIASLAATGDLINEGLDRVEMHLENWFQKWFGPPDPRKTMRVDEPPLVAYHWIVDVPQALKIANISAGGLQLITKDRWSEGNIISMTLQRTDKEKGSPESWIAVDFLVMRWCEDGMAGAFIPSAPGLAHTVAGRAGNCAGKKTLERFVARLARSGADRNSAPNPAPRQTIAAAYSGGA